MAESETNPDRVLIVRPSALGDVCRTVPALVTLKRAFPGATIDWVVQDTFVDAVRAHPDLGEVIPFPRDRFSRAWRSPAAANDLLSWSRNLRRRQYDVVYDLQGLSRSGAITLVSGARRRIGYRNAREAAWFGYTVAYEPPKSTHIVDQMLELLERDGIEPVRDMRLYVSSDADATWAARRDDLGLTGARYALLAPTSRWASKRWPVDRWAELVEPLRHRGFAYIVVIGAPGEEEQVAPLYNAVVAGDAVIDLVGQTTVGETMAAVRDSALVIANDSAPLHMAVGFGRPCVALFGPTDPSFVGPYGRPESVVRPFDPARHGPVNFKDPSLGEELMAMIDVGMVMDRLDAVLGSSPESAARSTRVFQRGS